MKKIIFVLVNLAITPPFAAASATSALSLEEATSQYVNEMNLLNQPQNDTSDQQVHFNKLREIAKTLLGITPNAKLELSPKITEFCKVLDARRNALTGQTEPGDQNAALKAKRDIDNFTEMSKFLRCTAGLFDAFYSSPQLLELVLKKIPEFVPAIGHEITVVLRVVELLSKTGEVPFDEITNKLREFARQSEDGTYLLSPLISAAMAAAETEGNMDFPKLLNETDFTKLDICRYLKIR
ncbi:MAG: hypothetical protein IJT08_00985 [Alphaproteobacteria bacterium]|nr:hypothetical protein [Alphaproteobacteria bacterium]